MGEEQKLADEVTNALAAYEILWPYMIVNSWSLIGGMHDKDLVVEISDGHSRKALTFHYNWLLLLEQPATCILTLMSDASGQIWREARRRALDEII